MFAAFPENKSDFKNQLIFLKVHSLHNAIEDTKHTANGVEQRVYVLTQIGIV